MLFFSHSYREINEKNLIPKKYSYFGVKFIRIGKNKVLIGQKLEIWMKSKFFFNMYPTKTIANNGDKVILMHNRKKNLDFL